MDIYMYKKDYFKESSNVKKALLQAVDCLYKRINAYELQGIAFNKIYNDDYIKYDKHGQFYTFKAQKENIQLRILYTYMIIDGNPIVLIADYIIKKKNKKDYINRFDTVNNANPVDMFEKSKFVNSISV
ncbi:MAG: hypothetical protein J1E81_02520 [Eubacterium sp.]|nr:hypothetical protein [Eubacterium sp.]